LEDDDLVDTVQKLRAEVAPHFLEHSLLGALAALAADVRGHDEQRVLEVHRAALASVSRPSSRICSRALKTSRMRLLIS